MTHLLTRAALVCIVMLTLVVSITTTLGARFAAPQVVYTTQDIMLYDVHAQQSISLSDARLAVPVSLSWSPDGRYIAYYTLSGAAYRLTVLDVRTLNRRSLTQPLASGAVASWSPDSTRVLVLAPNESQRADACTLYIADFSLACLGLSVNVSMAVWSPREALWAIVYYGENGQCVGLLNPDTQHLQDYECGASYTRPSWSPEGARLVYLRVKGSALPEVVLRELKPENETRYRLNVMSYLAEWQTDTRILLQGGHDDYLLNPQNGKITADNQDNPTRHASALDPTERYEASVMLLTQGDALELLVRRSAGYDTASIERWQRVDRVSSYAFAWRP